MTIQRIWPVAWASLGFVVAAGAAAQTTPELRSLFPQEADLFVSRPGVARLVLPADIVSTCRPDLSDLRIFDRKDSQVAFAVDRGVATDEIREATQTVPADVLDVKRDEGASTETYELAAPPPTPANGRWELVVKTARPEFVRALTATAVRADGVVVPLVEHAPLFRLAMGAGERTRVPLPVFSAQRVSVTIWGTEGFFLEPTFEFESARRLDAGARADVPVEEISRRTEDGRTIVDLARSPGLVPDLLRLTSSTTSFRRRVQVWDVGPAGRETRIGLSTILRVPVGGGIEVNELPLKPAQGERLRVEIFDQDSPPLQDLKLLAVVRRPALIFALSAASADEPAGTVRFGGGRADPPRYDLAMLLPEQRMVSGEQAEIATRLYDPAELAVARVGPTRENSSFDRTPALAFAMRAGSEINVGAFSYRRVLDVTPSSEGSSRLRLGPEDLARARADLGDLRVVDAQARQWPYLLARDAAADWVDLAIAGSTQSNGQNRYTLKLPVSPVRFDQLVLEIDAPFFHRAYRLVALHASHQERTLAQGELVRSVQRPTPVTISITPTRVDGLALIVDDGGDAPLPVRSVRARVPVADLFVAAPAGRYFLLFGNADERAPRYELAAVRDVVLAVNSAPVAAGRVERNPGYNLRARLTAGEGRKKLLQQVVLWMVLGFAVVVLTLVTVRLVRKE